VFAIVAVIAIHTVPFGYGKPVGHEFDSVLIINQVARFAVPFFFIVSGYFWSVKISSHPDTLEFSKKSAGRVGILFILWSLIYLAIACARSYTNGGFSSLSNDFSDALDTALSSPVTSILQGGKPHLWFLTALTISILVSGFLVAKAPCLLILLAITFYVIGLLGGAYKESPLGIKLNFDFRNGPFLSLICFVSGHLLRQIGPKRTWMLSGSAIVVVALAAQFTELTLLHSSWGTTMWQDYVGSTVFLGIGAAMMSLSNHRLLCLGNFSNFGPYILGIYALHYFFVDLFRNRHFFTTIPWLDDILYLAIVAACSYCGALILSRTSITKRIVVSGPG
jgi:surface polysaccharide O-acyltransferase-like enzyme